MTETTTPKTFDEHTYIVWMHISQLACFVGVPSFLIPLIMWVTKKDQYAVVNTHGKDILNFQITLIIAFAVAVPLCFILIGIPLVLILLVIQCIVPIIAASKVRSNELYRYPFAIQFLK